MEDATFVKKSAWGLAKNHTPEEVAYANHHGLNGAMSWICLIAFVTVGIGFGIGHHSTTKPVSKPKTEVVAHVNNQPALHKKVITPKIKRGFINKVGYPAVQAFKDDHHQVLPSIVIAQAIVESNWGTSGLCTQAHNIFGVKGAYNGKSANMPTTEYVNGNKIHVNANFRAYPNYEASILDHDQLLQNKFIGKKQDLNYHDVAYRIKAHHYATDPTYPQKLINMINTFHLYRYDKIGLK